MYRSNPIAARCQTRGWRPAGTDEDDVVLQVVLDGDALTLGAGSLPNRSDAGASSSRNSCGCSQAAKWPPLATSLK